MHVSAGNPFRRWPARSFAETAAALACADPARRVIVTSGPSESAAAEARRTRSPIDRRRRGIADRPHGRIRPGGACARSSIARRSISAATAGRCTSRRRRARRSSRCSDRRCPERSMPWRDPAIGAIACRRGAAPLPALPPTALRARRLSLPDDDFAYHGGHCRRAAFATGRTQKAEGQNDHVLH